MASVERHGDKYRVVWRENGQKQRRSFDTEDQARSFASTVGAFKAAKAGTAAFIENIARGKPTPTVAAYAKDLIPLARKQNTRDMYTTAVRRIEREPLGSMQIGKVTPAHVREFFKGLTANRDNIRSVLAKAVNAAVREGIIKVSPLAQANIRPGKPKGKTKQQRIRALTPDQVEALARAATTERDALCIRLGAYTGLRAGEVGGLRVEDIDFDDCRIYVRRNAQRTSVGFIFDDPKSETSERNIKVACSLVEDIALYIETHAPPADGTIFYTEQGNPVTDGPLTRATVNAAKAAGMYRKDEDGRQWPTFHKLRNTCASLLIAAKLEPKAIQTYLGHSSIRMTYDLYGDLFPKADEPLADTMEALRAAAERKALPSGEAAAVSDVRVARTVAV